jgi:pantoate--beta-alanine ligase
MRIVHTVRELRVAVAAWRRAGERVGFVPTMGNLHAGHHALLEIARRHAARVIASVFVNPTQFGPNEDFARYPRTLEADARGLDARGCDLVFAPSVEEMYPRGLAQHVRVHVPALSDVLDGAHRPGHFDGVATVVTRLLNMAQSDVAVFGRKDYQQLLVVRHLVADLALPVEIVAGDTVREADGLALSSRNQYLSPEQRARAPLIFRTLQAMAGGVRSGREISMVEGEARRGLEAAGFVPDYAVVRRASDLAETESNRAEAKVALIAARLGTTRLIDNLLIQE